ncbi:MAG: dihydrofolate reductase family protein [Mucilaginibacter sp.]
MRKLIFGINVSLDGCCDHTKFSGGDDILDYFAALLRDVDQLVYGRKTYELMVPFWPEVAKNQNMDKAANGFAAAFDAAQKILVSRTMGKKQDPKTKVIRNNLKDEIIKLKQQPGKAISTGGVDLPAQLMEMGLVDEFHVVVHPVIVGEGRRLFTDASLPEKLGLKLLDSKVLSSGCVALHYTTSENTQI